MSGWIYERYVEWKNGSLTGSGAVEVYNRIRRMVEEEYKDMVDREASLGYKPYKILFDRYFDMMYGDLDKLFGSVDCKGYEDEKECLENLVHELAFDIYVRVFNLLEQVLPDVIANEVLDVVREYLSKNTGFIEELANALGKDLLLSGNRVLVTMYMDTKKLIEKRMNKQKLGRLLKEMLE